MMSIAAHVYKPGLTRTQLTTEIPDTAPDTTRAIPNQRSTTRTRKTSSYLFPLRNVHMAGMNNENKKTRRLISTTTPSIPAQYTCKAMLQTIFQHVHVARSLSQYFGALPTPSLPSRFTDIPHEAKHVSLVVVFGACTQKDNR